MHTPSLPSPPPTRRRSQDRGEHVTQTRGRGLGDGRPARASASGASGRATTHAGRPAGADRQGAAARRASAKEPARPPRGSSGSVPRRASSRRSPVAKSASRVSPHRSGPPARPGRRAVAHPARRVRFLLLTVLFVFSLFSAQLLRLQALDASPVASAALKSRLYVSAVPAMRGDITDANGVVLATSIDRRNVTADQTAVPEYKKKINGVRQIVGVLGAAADLAPILGMSEVELTTTLTGARRFVYVAKGITPLSWRKIEALGIPGIFSEQTSTRSYPSASAVASLVG